LPAIGPSPKEARRSNRSAAARIRC
jgi:hypothetical protein